MLVRRNRFVAATIFQENAAAIRVLYTSNDFLMKVDTRFQEPLGRILTKLELLS